jgi:hypothetical protein
MKNNTTKPSKVDILITNDEESLLLQELKSNAKIVVDGAEHKTKLVDDFGGNF